MAWSVRVTTAIFRVWGMALAHWLLDGGFACFERRQALALRTSFILVHSTMKLLLEVVTVSTGPLKCSRQL